MRAYLDEYRIANGVARSSDWLLAEYAQTYTLGPEINITQGLQNNTAAQDSLDAGIMSSSVWPQASVYKNQQVYAQGAAREAIIARVA